MTLVEAVQWLKRLREERKTSQAKVAGNAGLQTSRLQNYESGIRDPDIETLRAWGKALGQELVFELRDPAVMEEADRGAEALRQMDPTRRRLALRLISLATTAEPAHLQAGLAAIRAIMIDAGLPVPDEVPGLRARA